MPKDMCKVIVERPRGGKEGGAAAGRLREDFDGSMRLGMRADQGYRGLNENLALLRRYLLAQLGRPWKKVFSEIFAGIDGRITVQQHIHQHIHEFIAVDVEVRDGRLIDVANRGGYLRRGRGITQELYVDPRTGLICLNRHYRSSRQDAAENGMRETAEIATHRRTVDERTLLLRVEGMWYRVELGVLPKERIVASVVDSTLRRRMFAEPRYDVVLRRAVSRSVQADLRQCKQLYGSFDFYAQSKRQLSSREIKEHQLR